MATKNNKRSGYVWIIAGLALLTYASIGLLGQQVPGVENLVAWVNSLSGNWIVVAAFIAILIEGLYFIGSFFPGSTIIIVVTVLSQTQSWLVFGATIAAIFIGWVIAGIVNIVAAYKLRSLKQPEHAESADVHDRFLTTWYPAFRATHEVAQVTAGGKPLNVFFSSLRVKAVASLLAATSLTILPLVVDITTLSNEEGFASVVLIGCISLTVGMWMIRQPTA